MEIIFQFIIHEEKNKFESHWCQWETIEALNVIIVFLETLRNYFSIPLEFEVFDNLLLPPKKNKNNVKKSREDESGCFISIPSRDRKFFTQQQQTNIQISLAVREK